MKCFRPKRGTNNNLSTSDIHEEIHSWLEYTAAAVTEGLKNSLELVTSIKGLHIIRQEALKIGMIFFYLTSPLKSYLILAVR